MNGWLFLLSLCLILHAATCNKDNNVCLSTSQDERVYLFAYGVNYLPFMDVNEDNELIGLNYGITRAICKAMNKKCEHMVYYDFNFCWDSSKISRALNNDWWDVCAGYDEIQARRSAYGFLANFTQEPLSNLYVRRSSSDETVEDVNKNAKNIAFGKGYWVDPACLKRQLGISTTGRTRDQFETIPDMKEALASGEVDAMFNPAVLMGDDDRFKRVNQKPVACAHAGSSFMMRKDRIENMMWLEEGLQKIRESGDYDWLCKNAEIYGDPGCF